MRGTLMMTVVAALAVPVAGAAQTAADPAADSLIGLWTDSVGGMSTYRELRAATFTVTTVWYDTATGAETRRRPRYVSIKKGPYGEESRIERQESYGTIIQGFNGRRTWAVIDGAAIPDTARDAREALYVARDVFYWVGLPFKLRDPGVYLRYRGRGSRPGRAMSTTGAPGPEDTREYHVVAVSFAAGVGEHQDVFTYYFAPGRGFPTEVTYVEEGRTSVNRMTWGPTGRFGPIRYPAVLERHVLSESGRRRRSLLIGDFVPNPDLPQSLFERP